MKIEEVQDILDASHVYPVVKRLLEKKVCIAWESLKEKYTPKRENFVHLHPDYHNEEALAGLLNQWNNRAPKQLELLLAFLHLQKTEGEVKQPALLKKADASSAQLKGLVDKNILVVSKQSVDRLQLQSKQVKIDFTLSPVQTIALEKLQQALHHLQAHQNLRLERYNQLVVVLDWVTIKKLLLCMILAMTLHTRAERILR